MFGCVLNITEFLNLHKCNVLQVQNVCLGVYVLLENIFYSNGDTMYTMNEDITLYKLCKPIEIFYLNIPVNV